MRPGAARENGLLSRDPIDRIDVLALAVNAVNPINEVPPFLLPA